MIIAFVALDKDGRVVSYGTHQVTDKNNIKKEIKAKGKRGEEIKTIDILMVKIEETK